MTTSWSCRCRSRGGQTAVFNLSLLAKLARSAITDAAQGLTLVDTGVPGQASAIVAALAELGLELRDLRRIILTHQDYDHIGSLAELARLSGAEILAGADEADAIDDTVLPRFALPETLIQRPELREVAAQYRPWQPSTSPRSSATTAGSCARTPAGSCGGLPSSSARPSHLPRLHGGDRRAERGMSYPSPLTAVEWRATS